MTVQDLLTMASGFDCDDRDSSSPGSEDAMQQQEEEPNWYRYTLALPMAREPGVEAVYCSAGSNLLGNVLSRATGETLPRLFHRLIAEPLEIDRYHLNLQPTGEPYMGGGIYWLPRDFMKLGQLYLGGGMWNGKRLLGAEFAARATEPLFEVRERHYGYLWWVIDYPYKGGSVKAFFAGGNGGQVVIAIPELDLLVTFFAGNYNDRVLYRMQDEFVPDYILPAVDGIGD
jgi:CubicO group peptidase (beta-lactamase class C family)